MNRINQIIIISILTIYNAIGQNQTIGLNYYFGAVTNDIFTYDGKQLVITVQVGIRRQVLRKLEYLAMVELSFLLIAYPDQFQQKMATQAQEHHHRPTNFMQKAMQEILRFLTTSRLSFMVLQIKLVQLLNQIIAVTGILVLFRPWSAIIARHLLW